MSREAQSADESERSGTTRVSVRMPQQVRSLIQDAAAQRGQRLSAFMLEAAQRQAEEVLLGRTHFVLNEEQTERFLEALDNPPPMTDKMRALLSSKAPWEK